MAIKQKKRQYDAHRPRDADKNRPLQENDTFKKDAESGAENKESGGRKNDADRQTGRKRKYRRGQYRDWEREREDASDLRKDLRIKEDIFQKEYPFAEGAQAKPPDGRKTAKRYKKKGRTGKGTRNKTAYYRRYALAEKNGGFGAKYAGTAQGRTAEEEDDNAAVEASCETGRKAEDLYRSAESRRRNRRRRRRKKAAGPESEIFKKDAGFMDRKSVEENPDTKKKALQKRIRKQRIKREYIKERRKRASAKTAEQSMEKTKNMTAAAAKKLQEAAARNAGLFVTAGIAALLFIMVMVSVSSCGAMFADTQSAVLASSYLSRPQEIDAADLQMTQLELDLQNKIDRIEADHPEYDEYSYNVAEIGHNPYTLISYLSAVHTEFTAGGTESEIQALFDEMYALTLTPDTEIRTRTVTKTGTRTVIDPATGAETEESYEYEEEEEYEVRILRVTLTAIPLESIAGGKMDPEQAEIFAAYRETNGLIQQFASPLMLYWHNYISSYYGYRKNPLTGNNEFHRGVDIAVPAGTAVYAAHDGTVTAAAYDSHYGNYAVIEKDGYTTKYAHMDSISVSAGQEITKGTPIGATGNTGSSTGSHLHIECLYDGEYYNPLFYFDVGEGTLYGEAPGTVQGNVTPPESYDDAAVQALMGEAAKYLGYPYVWGGSSPSTSFDCSGFVCWAFSNSGVHDLPRTTAQGIYDQCAPVSASDAQAGDIIFFTGTYNSPGPVSHVGIYCGGGVFIHAGDPIKYSRITPYWQSHFYGFGRL